MAFQDRNIMNLCAHRLVLVRTKKRNVHFTRKIHLTVILIACCTGRSENLNRIALVMQIQNNNLNNRFIIRVGYLRLD